MRLIVCLMILLCSCCVAQKEKDIWTNIEKKISLEKKKQILSSINDKTIEMMINIDFNQDVINLFHFIDLDADGVDEIIFNGYAGSANEFIIIYILNSSRYERAYFGYGHVFNIEVGESNIIKFMRPEMVGDDSGDSTISISLIKHKIREGEKRRIN